MRYLKDLQEGENVVGHYYCKQKQSMKSKAGKTYLSLRLADKTGTVDAKVWDFNNDIQNFEEEDFIKIDALVTIYNNEIQLNVKKIRKSTEGEYNPADYVPCSSQSIPDMYDELLSIVNSIKTNYIKKLLEAFFVEDKEIIEAFKSHSAAKSKHHNYLGGLLEHTLSVTKLCDYMSKQYGVNRDILVSTALLHDIGKVKELSEFPNNDYTDDGQLLGHIVMGTEMISQKIAKIDGFPDRLASLIKHSILSHHGEYEYGSPVLPKTIEAFLLHCADETDAKTKMYQDIIEADNTPGSWAGYSKDFNCNIRKTEI